MAFVIDTAATQGPQQAQAEAAAVAAVAAQEQQSTDAGAKVASQGANSFSGSGGRGSRGQLSGEHSYGVCPGAAPPQWGRWASVATLSALSLFLLVGDFLTFGQEAGGSWISELVNYTSGGYVAELTLITSATILLLTMKYGAPQFRNGRKSFSVVGPSASSVAGSSKSVGSKVREINPRAVRERGSDRSGILPTGQGISAAALARRNSNTVVAKWNSEIDQAARQGDAERAGQVLLEFERSGCQPESVSYNLVIRACAKRGDVPAAERWLKRMEARGVKATVCSYNTLLDACAKADNAESCERWLRHMLSKGVEANVISYATAIYARARCGDVAASEGWLEKMMEAGVQPDAVSYNSLIHACSVKGDAARAERWLEEMCSRGLETSVATYTAVIDACAKCGDVARAGLWFERMLEAGVEPNVVTFVAVIDSCAKGGNLAMAEQWHNKMTDRGIAPNAHSCSAVINACAKHGGPGGAEAAEEWLGRSERAGVVNDVVVYSSVIDACGKAGDAERALRVFRRMRENGLKPHIVAYAALARPFAYRGDWIKVESIAQSMLSDAVAPNEYFVYAQLLAYAVARPRQAQRAEACFRTALEAGVTANDHVVGVLARAVGRPRCGELMQELCGGREVPMPPPRRGQDGGVASTRADGLRNGASAAGAGGRGGAGRRHGN